LPTLVGSGFSGPASQGYSVGLSADGNTAIVGGPNDNVDTGAAWVFTRSNGVWTQQGSKLVGTGTIYLNTTYQGISVALSPDGNTAIVGGEGDNSFTGAAWVYTRSGGIWTQQGSKLVGSGAVGDASQGASVALSSDGNTAIVGGPIDNGETGAVWVYTRSNGVWTQQGSKLVGAGGYTGLGFSVSLSDSGNTAIVGGLYAAWVYTRSGGVWTQGNKLFGSGAVGDASQGASVALSSDGNTAIVGGPGDNSDAGAAWVFAQPPVPSLQVTPSTSMVATGNPGGPFAPSSFQYQLSATAGSINYSISGYPNWLAPSSTSGTASSGTPVTFTVTANANSLAVGTYGPTTITFTNSDTGQGTQTRTATLTVNPPSLQVSPATGIAASGTHGGPFSPSSFRYELSATYGSVKYSVTTPSWLTASPKTGTVTKSARTITFEVNSSAHSLQPNTYVDSVNFNNTTNGQGSTTRLATLTVNPKQFKITVEASPKADGTVSGGGTFAEGSSQTVTATPNTGHTFVHWTENGKVVSTSASYTFTLPSANVTLIADFH
jgi:Divergent InlB B-repeat domain/Viral BACON domain